MHIRVLGWVRELLRCVAYVKQVASNCTVC